MTNFWVRQKESTNFSRKMWPWRRNKKMQQKCTAKLWASNKHLQKVVTLFCMIRKALDSKSKIWKLKNEAYFHIQKEFLGYVFYARRYWNVRENGLPKLSFKMGTYFSVILSFTNFSLFSQLRSGVYNHRAKVW